MAKRSRSLPQYLEWHGQQYRAQIAVPVRLRAIVGKSKLVTPLHTDNPKEADRLKHQAVHKMKSELAIAEQIHGSGDADHRKALEWRLHVMRGEYVETLTDDLHTDGDPFPAGTQIIRNDARDLAIDEGERIARKQGKQAAERFAAIALGNETPIAEELGNYLADKRMAEKTGGDLRRVLGWLAAWLKQEGKPETIEAVDRRTAGAFIMGGLSAGRSQRKASAYLSFIRGYWEWLAERGHTNAESPWAGQKVRGNKDDESEQMRPFSDEEVRILLNGPARPELALAMRIAALSGMRIEEICQLTFADCADGLFRVNKGKTDSARRLFPIHSEVQEVITRIITKGKPSDFLIANLRQRTAASDKRSAPLVKAFTHYRRRLGVGSAKGDDKRSRSPVNFHSFRRWFVRKARDARLNGAGGFDDRTFGYVIGHAPEDRTKAHDLAQIGYAGPDSMDAKRALIEAVRLPDGVNSTAGKGAMKRPHLSPAPKGRQ
jgi:integrase